MLNTYQSELSIADLFKGDSHLSSPPNIFFELQKIVNNPNSSVADAAFVIEKDPSLALKLLKIVNSAFFGFSTQVATIDRAITLIGTKELQYITLSTIVIDKFSNLPGGLISMDDFWARSLRCALIAQELDHYLGDKFSDSIFLCGILHNIGQLVFFRRIPELAIEVSLILQAQNNSSIMNELKIEESIIGFNHFQVGAELTKLWKLPDIFTDTIRLHPYLDNTDKNHKAAAIVRLADCYSKSDEDSYAEITNNLGISSENMYVILEKAYQEFEDIFKVFYPR